MYQLQPLGSTENMFMSVMVHLMMQFAVILYVLPVGNDTTETKLRANIERITGILGPPLLSPGPINRHLVAYLIVLQIAPQDHP